jgi:hypothetical protein
MPGAICGDCASNAYLKNIIGEEDDELECSHCGELKRPAISAASLAALIEPIMREHFKPGKFDHEGIQDGEPLEGLVYEVVDQELEFADEVVDEIIELDVGHHDIKHGAEPVWEHGTYYVETKATSSEIYDEWNSALAELKHARRFFSDRAQKLFSRLFANVHTLKYWAHGAGGNAAGWKHVVFDLAAETELFRARVCSSASQRNAFFAEPLRELGPPPPHLARAGRMNAEGVPVLYCALAATTAIAEMRPAIGMELVVGTFRTKEPIRVLNFSLLEEAHGNVLSYLQPDFNEQVQLNHFLRRLHRLITQPIVPGRESDYLITQTMAEYLSHLANPPIQGVLFRSAQEKGGTNVVLFSSFAPLAQYVHEAFPVEYVEGSLSDYVLSGVAYTQKKFESIVQEDGTVVLYDTDFEPDDEDMI